MEKRVKTLSVFTILLLVALAGRLYYIQIVCHPALSEGAKDQQVIHVQSENERGTIYDRNLVKLTDTCNTYYYLINRENCTVGLERIMKSIDAELAGTKGDDYLVYKTDHFNQAVNEKLRKEYDAYGFCRGSRYEDHQTAAHLIGYVSGENKSGAAGLEKQFQSRLASQDSSLSMIGSGTGEPFYGIGVKETREREQISPSSLITTIDSALQKKVEIIMEEEGITGAVVVLQTETGQVLSMASTPTFNPNALEEYLHSQSGELVNKAVQGQYPPGSVFKIVVAAAALESGMVSLDDTFDCDGSTEVNGVTLTCDGKEEGHGKVDFTQAFAKSCNCFFAQAAKTIGAETIIDMAQRLGLSEKVLEGFSEEETGRFPDQEERSYSGLSNLAIGQGSLLTTPLQIAAMTNVIANGGIDRPVSVVRSQNHEEAEGQRVLTNVTAAEVAEMMEKVCTEGTAADSNTHVAIAGKTGSAEAGNGTDGVVHGWFTGYFPAEDPEYTVTVIAEDGKTGSGSALPVFEKIVNYLY